MRQINDHMRDVIGLEPKKPEQPKPSRNPLKWNWTAIITWTVIGIVANNIFNYLISLV